MPVGLSSHDVQQVAGYMGLKPRRETGPGMQSSESALWGW